MQWYLGSYTEDVLAIAPLHSMQLIILLLLHKLCLIAYHYFHSSLRFTRTCQPRSLIISYSLAIIPTLPGTSSIVTPVTSQL